MNKEKDKHIGLRIDSETHAKLKDLAEYEGRSINGEDHLPDSSGNQEKRKRRLKEKAFQSAITN